MSFIREEKTQTQAGREHQVTTEAEIDVMLTQAREHLGPSGAGRARMDRPLEIYSCKHLNFASGLQSHDRTNLHGFKPFTWQAIVTAALGN